MIFCILIVYNEYTKEEVNVFEIKKNVIPNLHACESKLNDLSVATVHEVLGKKNALSSQIKPIFQNEKVFGTALTVKTGPADNLMLIKAISMAEKGQVIVLDCGDTLEAGPFGEVLATECKERGVKALITNGSIRDSQQIRELNFPTYSRGISVRGTTKSESGLINHPISCGGVVVNPGDIILADEDGVVVIDQNVISEVIEKSLIRDDKEKGVMDDLKKGKSLFEIYGYEVMIKKLGIKEEK